MRCLLVTILALAVLVGAFLLIWNWLGAWGVLAALFGGALGLWVLARILPIATAAFFREFYRKSAGPMRDAQITVHSIVLADESDAAPEMLRQLEAWMAEFNPAGRSSGFDLIVDEFLSHNQEDPDLARYWIDLTVSPPESAPNATWAPYALTLRPEDSQLIFGCEIFEIQPFDPASGRFQPLELGEFHGPRRIRLHAGLDPTIPRYRFEYMFVNPLETEISPPAPDWDEAPMRKFTLGVLSRLSNYRPLRSLGLNWLEVHDEDLEAFIGFSELEYLGLDGTLVTDAGLSRLRVLTRLEILCLDYTLITNAGLEHLAALPKLKRLFLRKTEVTDSAIDNLRRRIAGLEVFYD